MKLDVGMPIGADHLRDAAQIARAADDMGFAGLWTSETKHDSLLPLVLAAEHSQTLQLGTSVAIAFSRSPMVLAQQAWDLQTYSNGRFLLGLGTQVKAHIERRFGIPWDAPVARLRDYIGALRAIWTAFQTDGSLRYEGKFYHLSLLTAFFNPGPIAHPEIPISIAGVNEGLTRLAGEVADGFHVHPLHSAKYIQEVTRPAIAEGAGRSGRPADAVEVSVSVFIVTGANVAEREAQREQIRQQIAFYASTPSYRTVLECHGWQEVGDALGRLARQQRWREMTSLVNDDMLKVFAIDAEPDDVGVAIRERYTGLVDRVSLYMPFIPGQQDGFWRNTLRSVTGDRA